MIQKKIESDIEFTHCSRSISSSANSPRTLDTDVGVEKSASFDKRPAFRLFMFFKPCDSLLLCVALISSMLNSLVPVATTILLGRIFEKLSHMLSGGYSSPGSFIQDMKSSTFAIALVGLGSFVFNWISIFAFMEFGERQQIRCRRRIFTSLLKKQFSWFDERSELNGGLIQINRCVEEFRGAVSECLCMFLTNVFTIVALLVTSFIYSWRLTLVAIAGFPVIAAVGIILGNLIEKYTRLENDRTGLAAKTVDWNLTSYQWVKLVNGQANERRKFTRQVDGCASAFTKLTLFSTLSLGVIKALSLMMFVQSFWFGSYLINKGLSTSGNIVSCFYACLTCATLFNGIAHDIVIMQKGNISLNQILEFIGNDDEKVDHIHDSGPSPLMKEEVQGDIVIDNISFSYPFRKDVQVLKGVDIKIPSNKTTYIVGTSGSGKSSLSNLLLKFYDYKSYFDGRSSSITLDGFDIKDFKQSFLTDVITLVQQSNVLFSGTLKENIEFGAPVSDAVSLDLLNEATRMSQLDSTIELLPDGQETKLGKNGNDGIVLSGGQQQRVALARARVKDSPILILDEATSALDRYTLKEVISEIKEWRRGKTTLVLTHDFSQIGDNELVYVMQEGRVVEYGQRKDLLKKEGGRFAALNVTDERKEEEGAKEKDTNDYDEYDEDLNSDIISLFSLGNENYREGYPRAEFRNTIGSRFSIMFGAKRGETKANNIIVNDIENQIDEVVIEKNEKEKAKVDSTDLMGVWRVSYYFRNHIRKELSYLVFGILVSIANAACNPVFSYYFAKLIDGIVPSSTPSNKILHYSLTTTGIALLDGSTLFISKFLMGYISERLICSIRKAAFEKIVKQNMNWFNHCQSAELTALLLNDARDLRHIVSDFLVIIVNVAVMIVFGTIWSIICGWKLALVGLSFVPLFLFVGVLYSVLLEKVEDRYKTAVSGIENQVHECLTGIKTVLCLNLKSRFLQRFQDRAVKCRKVGLSRANIVGFGDSLPNVLLHLAQSVLLFYGFKLIAQGHYSTVQVMEVFSLMLFSMSNALALLTSCPDITKGQRAGTYLARLLETTESASEFRGYAKPRFEQPRGECLIKLENVSYSYSSNGNNNSSKKNLVLSGVDFEIMQGESVAIVGESGSGKSTLLSLLLRLYKFFGSKSSSIEVLGYNINDVNVEYLRDHIAVVPQTAVFFEGTVLQNLTYSLPERLKHITENPVSIEEKVWDILELVDLKDFFKNLPDQLNSKVGDANNTLFSGGQAQRLSIARALMRDPTIIILDEATSALDPDNSKKIRDFVANILGPNGKITVLMITHSVEMMKIADKIVDLGDVCEVGTFDELISKGGQFTKLIQSC